MIYLYQVFFQIADTFFYFIDLNCLSEQETFWPNLQKYFILIYLLCLSQELNLRPLALVLLVCSPDYIAIMLNTSVTNN